MTGDLMFRSHAMVQHNQSPAAVEANQHVLRRLITEYPRIMIVPNRSFGIHSLFAIVFAIPACFFLRVERWRLLVLWAVLPWTYLNFGTSNLTHYWALPAADRYILLIYPPLFMLSAKTLMWLRSRGLRASVFVN